MTRTRLDFSSVTFKAFRVALESSFLTVLQCFLSVSCVPCLSVVRLEAQPCLSVGCSILGSALMLCSECPCHRSLVPTFQSTTIWRVLPVAILWG